MPVSTAWSWAGRPTISSIGYGTWPYENKPCWVCTKSRITPLAGADLKTAEEIDSVIDQAQQSGLTHLWLVGGGQLASAFLDRGLISHLSISEMPIRLERGVPLFANHRLEDIPMEARSVSQRTKLKQIEMTVVRT
ncbi:MAG: hypothetical protein Aurels2KO_33520 [Aureliella sp.]